MSKFAIRRAGPEDAAMLSRLSTETFWETYHENPNSDNEDIKAYMAIAYDVGLLTEEIESDAIVFLVAEIGDETAGYARLVIGSTVDGLESEAPLEISRIYLFARFHGRGYGKQLLDACLEVAKANNCDVAWLSVWKYNPKAIGFYERMGFRAAGRVMFDLAGTMHEDLLMAKEV